MGGKKILVTGGAGYIGAHSCLSLQQAGYEPIILDNLVRSDERLLNGLEKLTGKKPVFINADCADISALRHVFLDHGPVSGVMHFAALKSVGESVQRPLLYYQNNIQSLVILLTAMSEFSVRDIIFSSSCTVYGQPEVIPVSESAPLRAAESPYGATKQMCERILEDSYKTGFRIISLRYFNPIGAHPSSLLGELPIGVPSNLVPYITQTAIGKRQELVVFGSDYNTPDGSCIRDYIHVLDIADAHVKAMTHLGTIDQNFFDVFNLGTGKGVSVLELVNRFMKVSGVKLNYVLGPRRPGDVEKTFADPAKANKVMNWVAQRSIDEALKDAWNWERALSSSKVTAEG
jgi:UDP-glucose 4-epimerase